MSGNVSTPDVVVVGGGPVGLLLALLLGGKGREVVVLERRDSLEEPADAPAVVNIMQPPALDVFARLNLLDGLLEGAGEILGAEAHVNGELLAAHTYETTPGCPLPYSLSTRLSVLRTVLLAAVREQPTIRLVLGASVEELTDDGAGSRGLVVTTEDGTERFAPGYVIACDGKYSTLREWSGIQAEVVPSEGGYLDVRLPMPADWDKIAKAHFGEFGYVLETRRGTDGLVLVWISDANVVDMFANGPLSELQKAIISVLPHLDGWLQEHVTDQEQVRQVQHHFVRADRWSADNVVLLGDSAHGMHAFGGQGLNTSIQDAVCIAAAIHHELDGGEPGGIEQYLALRKPFIDAFQDLQMRNSEGGGSDDSSRVPDFEVLALGQPETRGIHAAALASLT
jgi:2-polyprenyl-6-methoxyphenol hydroxylase-like FAD-dependent oxidoreductase